jgi:hypothetical protein
MKMSRHDPERIVKRSILDFSTENFVANVMSVRISPL